MASGKLLITLKQFVNVFHDEETCKLHLKKIREQHGIICKKCGYDRHYWLESKEQWQCSACDFRTSLRSGTIMEGAKLPIRMWYIGMVCNVYARTVITVTELQTRLGHNRYQSIWSMMCKVRTVKDLDAEYGLFDLIKYDKEHLEIIVRERNGVV